MVLRDFCAACRSCQTTSPFAKSSVGYSTAITTRSGMEIPEKKLRASFSRPSLDEIVAFRAHVDQEMERLLARPVDDELSRRIILGLNHEQQHQELALTDIKHAFFSNPLHPSYAARAPLVGESGHAVPQLEWHAFNGGLIEIGYPA